MMDFLIAAANAATNTAVHATASAAHAAAGAAPHAAANTVQSAGQQAALNNAILVGGLLSFAEYALVAAAFYALRISVTKVEMRKRASGLAIAGVTLMAYGLYAAANKGETVTLGNALTLVNIFCMYGLYDAQKGSYISEGAKTASGILMILNILMALLSLISTLSAVN